MNIAFACFSLYSMQIEQQVCLIDAVSVQLM